MTQETTVLKSIAHLLFGYKYYAVILNTRGTKRTELTSFIFRTKEEVKQYKESMETNLSYKILEVVSFRSRNGFYHRPDDPVDHCIR